MRRKLKIDGRTYDSVEAEALAVALSLTRTYLRPKADRDERSQEQRRRAGFSSGRKRAVETVNPAYQAEYDRLHAANRRLSHTRITDLVAAKFGCSGRTVRNHVIRFTDSGNRTPGK